MKMRSKKLSGVQSKTEGKQEGLIRPVAFAALSLGSIMVLTNLIWMSGLSFVAPAYAETFHLGTQESEQLEAAEPVYTPRPTITEEMLEAGIKAFCVARFEIGANGKSKVHLVTSTGSAEVDELTLSTLRTWRFNPGKRGGIPVASVRKIKVEFEVD